MSPPGPQEAPDNPKPPETVTPSPEGEQPPPPPNPPSGPEEVTVLAVDLEGAGDPREIYRFRSGLRRASLSPDGRYLFFAECEPCYEPGTYTPTIVDLRSGQALKAEQQLPVVPIHRNINWTAGGFFIEPLLRLLPDGKLDRMEPVRAALSRDGMELAAAEVSPDGSTVAALLIPQDVASGETVSGSLMLLDLAGKQRAEEKLVLEPEDLMNRISIGLLWAPDSTHLLICPVRSACRLLDVGEADSKAFPEPVTGEMPSWSSDARHILYPGLGVVGLDGNILLPVPEMQPFWDRTGRRVMTAGERLIIRQLDGSKTEVNGFGEAWIIGWLPDGQLVVGQ